MVLCSTATVSGSTGILETLAQSAKAMARGSLFPQLGSSPLTDGERKSEKWREDTSLYSDQYGPSRSP